MTNKARPHKVPTQSPNQPLSLSQPIFLYTVKDVLCRLSSTTLMQMISTNLPLMSMSARF